MIEHWLVLATGMEGVLFLAIVVLVCIGVPTLVGAVIGAIVGAVMARRSQSGRAAVWLSGLGGAIIGGGAGAVVGWLILQCI